MEDAASCVADIVKRCVSVSNETVGISYFVNSRSCRMDTGKGLSLSLSVCVCMCVWGGGGDQAWLYKYERETPLSMHRTL